ncbi:MAG: ribonuclease III [Cystobacterineae bacterium]|nr:ribonuclease III [Cystobacterineae bacterium]
MGFLKIDLNECIASLEQQLQVRFSSFELAKCALTHRSYVHENQHETREDNERLEFLGDAVLELAISHHLMEMLPHASEGELSKYRAFIVSEETLANVARRIGLGDFLLLGKGEEQSCGREKNSVLADALEAILGALYLSVEWKEAVSIIHKLFAPECRTAIEGKADIDYKSTLQEKAFLWFRETPYYQLISEEGPAHAKIFGVEVFLSKRSLASAQGRNKKEAEQKAAKAALEILTKVEP